MRPTREGRHTPMRAGLVYRGIGIDPVISEPEEPIDVALDGLTYVKVPVTAAGFPVIEQTTASVEQPSTTTNHVIALPDNIVEGDLLVLEFTCYSTPTITFPSTYNLTWVEIVSGTWVSAFGNSYRAMYAIAGPTVSAPATGASITVTTSSARRSAWVCRRITGHDSADPPEGTIVSQSTPLTLDCPSHTASWGTADNLWIASSGYLNGECAPIDEPTDYSDLVNPLSTSATEGVGLASSHRLFAAGTDDPAGMEKVANCGTSTVWSATIVVKPGTSGAPADPIWEYSPELNDGDDATYKQTALGDEVARLVLNDAVVAGSARLRIGTSTSGSKTYRLQGATAIDFSDAVDLDSVTFTGTGSFTAQDVAFVLPASTAYPRYQVFGPTEDRRFFTLEVFSPVPLTSAAIGAHVDDPTDAHDASAISVSPAVNGETDVQGSLEDHETRIDALEAGGTLDVEVIASAGATETIDYATARYWDLTLDANCTLSITNPPADQTWGQLVIVLRQGGTGSYTVTWPASVQWADVDGTSGGPPPTLFTAVGAVDVVTLVTEDGGITWGGSHGAGGSPIDYAEAGDLAAVGTAAAAGTSAEVPRADHVHTISSAAVEAAGRWEPVVTDTGSGPELVFTSGDIVVTFVT